MIICPVKGWDYSANLAFLPLHCTVSMIPAGRRDIRDRRSVASLRKRW